MRSFLVVAFALASVCAGSEWNAMKATFDKYYDMPWDVKEATAHNKWVKVDEDKELHCHVYSQPNDPRIMLLFDNHGTICGVRVAFLKEDIAKKAQAGGHTFDVKHDEIPMYKKGKVFGKDLWSLTALFLAPSKLASGGRRPLNKATDELAEGIYFYDGSKWVEISKDECKISSDFTEANCFRGMGKHYFYKTGPQTDCTRRASLFPLYHRGRLSGLGLGSYGSFTEDPKTTNYYENISASAVKNIVPNGPKCMAEFFEKYGYTSVHLYFIKGAKEITCPQKDWRSIHC